MTDDGWAPGRWWQVFDDNGKLWCETSDEKEARESMRKGYTLYRLYQKQQFKWVKQ